MSQMTIAQINIWGCRRTQSESYFCCDRTWSPWILYTVTAHQTDFHVMQEEIMNYVGIVGDHYLLFWLFAFLFNVNCALSKKTRVLDQEIHWLPFLETTFSMVSCFQV